MHFFHIRAAKCLASLLAMPLGTDANAEQLGLASGRRPRFAVPVFNMAKAVATAPAAGVNDPR